MKKYFLFYMLITFLMNISINAQTGKNSRFFIMCTASGDTSAKYAGSYERTMAYYLVKMFPCVKATTEGDIRTMLGREKLKQILDGNIKMRSFCEYLACDYFINLEISDFLSDQVVVSASCLYYKKVDPMIRFASHGGRNYADIKNMVSEVSKTLVEKLAKYEICPFKGTINVAIISDKDTTMTETYSVYCNNSDQTYRKEEITKNHTESTWNLEKKNRNWTDGDMHFYSEESYTLSEENGCYKCKSGREGGRIDKEKRSYKVNGKGLSHQSIRDGKEQLDTRSELIFYDNQTYSLKVQGTSLPANADEEIEISAEGTCDNIPNENKTIKQEVTVPLSFVFGPFKGSAIDKVLSHKDTIKRKDPVSGEDVTISYEFNLKRD